MNGESYIVKFTDYQGKSFENNKYHFQIDTTFKDSNLIQKKKYHSGEKVQSHPFK